MTRGCLRGDLRDAVPEMSCRHSANEESSRAEEVKNPEDIKEDEKSMELELSQDDQRYLNQPDSEIVNLSLDTMSFIIEPELLNVEWNACDEFDSVCQGSYQDKIRDVKRLKQPLSVDQSMMSDWNRAEREFVAVKILSRHDHIVHFDGLHLDESKDGVWSVSEHFDLRDAVASGAPDASSPSRFVPFWPDLVAVTLTF